MRAASGHYGSAQYRIEVKSHLDFHRESWFDGMKIEHTQDGHTILTGEIIDQSALYGLLEKIRNLNLTLISVLMIDENNENEQNTDGAEGWPLMKR